MRNVLAVLMVFAWMSLYAQEPIEIPSKTSKPLKTKSAGTKNRPARDERGTETSPLVIKGFPPVVDGKDASEKRLEQQMKERIDLWMVILTALLVAVGFGQIYMFYRQLRAMKETVDDTKGIAESAKNSANAALRTSENIVASERAYVTMSDCPPGLLMETLGAHHVIEEHERDVGVFAVNVRVKNFGRTPARITNVILILKILPKSKALPDFPDYVTVETPVATNAFLVAGQEVSVSHSFNRTPDDVSKAKSGEVTLWLYGYVDYIDQFGQRHRGGYGRVYHPIRDDRDNYNTAQAFAERCNLSFLPKSKYHYDRPRTKGEGSDWD